MENHQPAPKKSPSLDYKIDVVNGELEKALQKDRGVRLMEVLFRHEELLRQCLKGGVTAREVHSAFLEGGVKTGFPYFSVVFADFRKRLGIPSRRRAGSASVPTLLNVRTSAKVLPLPARPGQRAPTATELLAQTVART